MNAASLLNIKFSPIYDSGSSLGREIPEEKIIEYIDNEEKIIKYIKSGKSEVKWDTLKINHFELLKKIKKNYPEQVKKTINKVIEKYNSDVISNLIYNIDASISSQYQESSLSLQRKKLIIKFIELRIKSLKEVLD